VIPKLSERRPELPAELDQVIARACASAAEDRFADVDELHEALKQAAAGELPPGTQRDSIPLAPAEVRGLMRGRTSFELRAAFERRRLRRNVVIAGCAIALVAGGAAWLLGGRMIGPPHGPHDRPPPSPTVHLQIEPAFAELKASDLTHGGAMLPVRGDTIELPRGTSALRLKLEAQGREPVLVDVVPDVDGVLRVSGTQ
jgi:hypothetical protein